MSNYIKSRSSKKGLEPGSLVHIGEVKRDSTKIAVYKYNEQNFEVYEPDTIYHDAFSESNSFVTWVNIEGLHDVKLLDGIGKHYKLHPLIIEDILNTDQRPKIEVYKEYIFISIKTIEYDKIVNDFIIEQQSIIIGNNYVLSFGERDTDIFEPIITRLKNGVGRGRMLGPDYMAYSLLDIIVDNYYSILEGISDRIEAIEDETIERASSDTLKNIRSLRRQVLFLNKSIWPLREIMSTLERRESDLIKESTEAYIRDLYDHVIQVLDTSETLRDILTSTIDIYISNSSNKMNEIMKVLTIISTVFMPLSFIVGVYGMNIGNMPELHWRWTYPILWAIMIFISIIMLVYFKKKKWW